MRVAVGGYLLYVNSFVTQRMDLEHFQRVTLTGEAMYGSPQAYARGAWLDEPPTVPPWRDLAHTPAFTGGELPLNSLIFQRESIQQRL
jgi:hypothetical protein